jgi:outer membrane biosynthesis protein TonB
MAVAHLRVGCLLRKQHKSEEAKKAKAAADQFFGAGAAGKQMQIVEGGVINGKAISKPAPAYPAEAKQVRAQGTIEVQLLVGETGSVLYACATEKGHPSLRRASELAAYSSRFTPTTLNGKPVKVMGVITYNFVLQ